MSANSDKDLAKLVEGVMSGDSDAFTRLLAELDRIDSEQDKPDLRAVFDHAALVYAMGDIKDNESEWPEFRLIVDRYDAARRHLREADFLEKDIKQATFDGRVLEKMGKTDTGLSGILFQLHSDLERARLDAAGCEAWIEVARTCLSHERFARLSDDAFDELVDAVSFELSNVQMDDDETDGGDDDDDDDGETFESFDDCAVCQGMKRAKDEGRNLGEADLQKLFDEANDRRGE